MSRKNSVKAILATLVLAVLAVVVVWSQDKANRQPRLLKFSRMQDL